MNKIEIVGLQSKIRNSSTYDTLLINTNISKCEFTMRRSWKLDSSNHKKKKNWWKKNNKKLYICAQLSILVESKHWIECDESVMLHTLPLNQLVYWQTNTNALTQYEHTLRYGSKDLVGYVFNAQTHDQSNITQSNECFGFFFFSFSCRLISLVSLL